MSRLKIYLCRLFLLLALALIVFGMAKLDAGAKALGGVSAVVGVVALLSNAASMAMGRVTSGKTSNHRRRIR